jgi:DNA-binding XRE family transcriptional regulator
MLRRCDSMVAMQTSTTHLSDSLQTTLQTARKSKRLSQLELALRMGVSQRHVSFVESGRAQPSRELLLSWLHELQAPLALRNVALAAGWVLRLSTAVANWQTPYLPRCAMHWAGCCKRTTPCPPW